MARLSTWQELPCVEDHREWRVSMSRSKTVVTLIRSNVQGGADAIYVDCKRMVVTGGLSPIAFQELQKLFHALGSCGGIAIGGNESHPLSSTCDYLVVVGEVCARRFAPGFDHCRDSTETEAQDQRGGSQLQTKDDLRRVQRAVGYLSPRWIAGCSLP